MHQIWQDTSPKETILSQSYIKVRCSSLVFQNLNSDKAKDFWKEIKKLNQQPNTIHTLMDGDVQVDRSQRKSNLSAKLIIL